MPVRVGDTLSPNKSAASILKLIRCAEQNSNTKNKSLQQRNCVLTQLRLAHCASQSPSTEDHFPARGASAALLVLHI